MTQFTYDINKTGRQVVRMGNMIEVNNLTKSYVKSGKQILNNTTFAVEAGGFYAVMGSSGSGKTTLLNVIGGIDIFDSGDITIDGVRISALNRNEMADFRLNNVGIVYQDYNLIDCLTLRENIILPLHNKDIVPSEFIIVSNEVAAKFGIEEILDRYPHEVSGGEQQRAAICRAIINRPKMVLADEPTGNLDSQSTTIVMQCFEKLNKEDGITILMVTHDLYTASYCDKVMLFKDGMITSSLDRDGMSRKEFYRHILTGLELGDIYE